MIKKIFFLFVLVVVFATVFALFVIFAGRGGGRVEFLTISYNNGPVSPEYHVEDTLKLVPDYGLRTVKVSYSSVFPYKKEGSKEVFNGEGMVGGEYFDRFESVLTVVKDMKNTGDEAVVGCTGGKNMSLDVGYPGEASPARLKFYLCGVQKSNVEFIESFYNDVTVLLKADVS